MELRPGGVALRFTRGATSIEVTAPADAVTAPVGSYMLYLLNGKGVPAVAPIVHVG